MARSNRRQVVIRRRSGSGSGSATTLCSGPLSLFTAKVRIALAEKGLPYELVWVPFSRAAGYAPKLPEMLAINPKGQVPVLIDDELAIYDSTRIRAAIAAQFTELDRRAQMA